MKLVELTAGMPAPDLTRAIACPKCKTPMELDDLAESYLGFNDGGR